MFVASIVCRTGLTEKGDIDREVKVEIVDRSETTAEYTIRGEASSGHHSFSYRVRAGLANSMMPSKDKRLYLLTLQVSRYCLLALQRSIYIPNMAR